MTCFKDFKQAVLANPGVKAAYDALEDEFLAIRAQLANQRAPLFADATGRVLAGSGNVFADLGFDKDEAEELQVKALLTYHISLRLKALELTPWLAAKRLGISPREAEKLLICRYTEFDLARL